MDENQRSAVQSVVKQLQDGNGTRAGSSEITLEDGSRVFALRLVSTIHWYVHGPTGLQIATGTEDKLP